MLRFITFELEKHIEGGGNSRIPEVAGGASAHLFCSSTTKDMLDYLLSPRGKQAALIGFLVLISIPIHFWLSTVLSERENVLEPSTQCWRDMQIGTANGDLTLRAEAKNVGIILPLTEKDADKVIRAIRR